MTNQYQYFLKRIFLLVFFVILAILTRIIITGDHPTVNLAPASTLAGPVSVGIGQTSSSALPQEGKDYQIKSVKFFENKEWAVVKILPLKDKADPAILVLKKVNGVYQAVLGPAGQFNSSYFYVMPLDVGQYLAQQGAYNG